MRVLDLACGRGCHAILAAERGASVVGIDSDDEALRAAEKAARKTGARVEWMRLDPSSDAMPRGPFDLVMTFGFLDRPRLPVFLDAVKPGGHFLAEMFLEAQQELGWGPTDQARLLKAGEVWTMFRPYELVVAREVLEILDGRTLAVAGALVRRPSQ
jgi:cyclopropane fatty-acyl-phospholipid synthase-like methyltransferase